MNDQPKVIFLDAVGTLFGVRESVGDVYKDITRQFGVDADAARLNQAFFHSFKAATPMAFPNVKAIDIPAKEYAWWEAIAVDTFTRAELFDQFTDFSAFFAVLYDHFATADPWFVYPETRDTLTHWRDRGIELGVLSNFDSRLYPVLNALGLTEFFSSITISTEVGAAKPDRRMFEAALNKHNCPASAAWHIGDSFKEDYQGAKAAGLKAFWLKRRGGSG